MKKILITVALCLVVVVIILLRVCDFGMSNNYRSNNSYLVNIQDVTELDNIDTGTIYFGADFCPTCVEFKPILENFCNKNSNSVLYFDLGYLLDNKIIDDGTMDEILENYSIEKIPTLVNIKDFEVDAMITFGYVSSDKTASISNQIEKFIYHDVQEKQGLLTLNNIEMLTIALMILTVISGILVLLVVCEVKKGRKTHAFFVFHLVSVCSAFVLRRLLINGADMYYWVIDSKNSIILFTTFLIDLIAIILLLVFRKRNEQE